MSINIGPPAMDDLRPKITVIGVGGAGGNAIANMIAAKIEGVDFVVANTDAQALSSAAAEMRIQLGPEITGGLGAGARPEVGKAAAEETVQEIEEALDGVNMCFIAAGMGGGTGTGAAAVIAEAARRKGVLTVGVVTKPFLFEGTRRMRAAEAGIAELQRHVDTLIVIPNQNLFLVAKAETTFKEAFQLADEVLQQGVRSITDLMVMPGLINLDFADVKSVMEEMGKAMMGTGEGEGENRALEAAERAIANPLLDGVSMQGAKGVIISIIGGEDMKLLEVDEAANHIRELVDDDANIIWGSAFNPDLDGKIRVSVVATGIETAADADQGSGDAHSLSMGNARAPKRPAMNVSEASQAAGFSANNTAEEPLNLSAFSEEAGAEDDDRGADPMAGLRRSSLRQFDEEPENDFAGLNNASDVDGGGFNGNNNASSDAEADELLLNTDRLAEDDPSAPDIGDKRRGLLASSENEAGAEQAPVFKPVTAPGAGKWGTSPYAGPLSANSGAAAAGGSGGNTGGNTGSGGGSTLFERMANLSRGSSSAPSSEEDEDENGDSSLNIPRFLGRQNNQ